MAPAERDEAVRTEARREIDRAWEPYRRIVREVPPGRVAECTIGFIWTLVQTDAGGVGIARSYYEGLEGSQVPGGIAGTDLPVAAGWLTSWNFFEAAVGCAAVNAAVNTRERVEAMTGRSLEEIGVSGTGLFDRIADRFAGGKVTVVGHFPVLKKMAAVCDLTILERQPDAGDLPDPACEYVLPEQDCVCITGAAVTNKTLPRLLDLSRSAYVALAGPSVPLSPVWFDYGVDVLAGAVVTDPASLRRCVQEGADRRVFGDGLTTITVAAEDVRG
jgi:uncharacterized protein